MAEANEQKEAGSEPSKDEGGNQGNDVLNNLNLSEDAKKQLQGNNELLNVLTHNISAKRDANSEAKTMREELQTLKKAKTDEEKAKLKENGEFEKLYNESLDQIKEEKEKLKKVTIKNKVDILGAQKGIKKAEYLKMFDASSFNVDENLQVSGLDTAFDTFVQENPDLFGNGQQTQAPSIDPGKPNLSNNNVNQADLQKLEKNARSGDIRHVALLRSYKKQNNLL